MMDQISKSAQTVEELIDSIEWKPMRQKLRDSVQHFPVNKVDKNHNEGILSNKECPQCRYFGSVIWTNPNASVSVSDKTIGGFWISELPTDDSIVACPMCGYEGQFFQWSNTSLSEQDPEYFEEDDIVCCLRRRKGTGREWVDDLYKFRAKKGADKVIRWCIIKPALLGNVRNRRLAQQVSRFFKLRFIDRTINHREEVKTKARTAQKAITGF